MITLVTQGFGRGNTATQAGKAAIRECRLRGKGAMGVVKGRYVKNNYDPLSKKVLGLGRHCGCYRDGKKGEKEQSAE